MRARDTDKDQTYFLYGLRQDQLEHARFPLGELTKSEVRDVARSLGLVTAEKPESQEICFVPGGDYRVALQERAGWQPEAGPLLDVDGERVGEHHGTAGYTVGQRQGLGVALGQPRYVSRIDPLTQHDHARPPRGSRDDDGAARAGDVRDRQRAGRRRQLVPGRDPDPPSGRAGARDHPPDGELRGQLDGASSTDPCGPPHRARPRSSTQASSSWVGVASCAPAPLGAPDLAHDTDRLAPALAGRSG